jgi:hypothetical protein
MRNPFLGTTIAVLGGSAPVATLIRRQLEELRPALIEAPTHQEVRLPEEVDKLPRDYDLLINFAALSRPGPTNRRPREALEMNVITVRKLLDHYRKTGTHIVCVSSVKTSLIQSMYGWSKLAAEAIVASAPDDVHATIVRLGNIVETAPSILGMANSIQNSHMPGSFITSCSEYYQTSDTVLDSVGAAIGSPPGSIVTPLLPPVPLPFIAGYLAGHFASTQAVSLNNWAPDCVPGEPSPPLIPDWWLPYTSVIEGPLSEASACPGYYLITNFRERRNSEEIVDEIRAAMSSHGRARLGQFAQKLSDVLRQIRVLLTHAS